MKKISMVINANDHILFGNDLITGGNAFFDS